MSKRNIAIAGFVVGLALTASPILAQDQPPAPQPSADQSQGTMVSIVVGGDLLTRGGQSFDAGDYQKALQDYSLFILLNPTFGEAYHLRGLAYARLNSFDLALADLNQSLSFPQGSDQITGKLYSDRALIYLQQNDAQSALKDLEASIAVAPDMPSAYSQRARVYLLTEQYADALKDYDKLIELMPDYSPGYAGRALANSRLEKADEAISDYDHFIELEPNNAGGYAERAVLKLGQAKYDAALVDMNTAIKLQPDDPSLYLQRGIVNLALNDQPAAAADYLAWIRKQEIRSVDGDPLQPGESQVLPMQQGLSYELPFVASAGQHVTLTASTRENSKTDPLIVLLDPTSTPILASDDSDRGSYDSAIKDFVIPANGTYTLVVSHASGSPNGAVRVLLQAQ